MQINLKILSLSKQMPCIAGLFHLPKGLFYFRSKSNVNGMDKGS